MSAEFQIAETEVFLKAIDKPELKRFRKKITDYIYPALRQNPFFGPNIKQLKGELRGIFRYRVGRYRVFYTVDPDKKLVFLHAVTNRKDAYRPS